MSSIVADRCIGRVLAARVQRRCVGSSALHWRELRTLRTERRVRLRPEGLIVLQSDLSERPPAKPGRGRSFRRAPERSVLEYVSTGAQSKHRPRPGSAGVLTVRLVASSYRGGSGFHGPGDMSGLGKFCVARARRGKTPRGWPAKSRAGVDSTRYRLSSSTVYAKRYNSAARLNFPTLSASAAASA